MKFALLILFLDIEEGIDYMKKILKVPVILQMESTECGAACLCMVMAYYKKWVTLEKMRSDCNVSRDGSNAGHLVKTARNYGFKSAGYRCGIKSIKEMNLPAIIHWGFNHFVVLCGFRNDYAVINDPACGRIKVSLKEFDEYFTGIVLTFEPTEALILDGCKRSILDFAKKRLHGTSSTFLYIVMTGILTAAVSIAVPVLSRIYIDEILSGLNSKWLIPFLWILCGVFVFQTVALLMQTLYLLKIRGKLAVSSNAVFMWHVLRLPIEFFSQRFAGDIANRQTSNEKIAQTLIGELAPIVLHLAMTLLYLLFMLKYSVLLTAIGIITVIINIFVTQYISKKRINLARSQMRDEGKLASIAVSGIEMIETIKASGAEDGFFSRWSGYHSNANNIKTEFNNKVSYIEIIPELMAEIANLTVLFLGAYLIMSGNFTAGMLLAFQGFLSSFIAPVNSILKIGQNFQEMRADMERVEDVMNYKTDVEYSENKNENPCNKLTGKLEMKNVTFGYNKLVPPLVENFNLTLQPGKSVALVGGSGSGKSTLAKLISGLYRPWSGEIYFDHKKIDEIEREIFTGSLAVVDQDIVLFEDTISENLRMWDKSIEDFEILLAARDAQIHEDIMKRDGGYQSVIKEDGKNFSGGQCQRLEIARVLAQDPTIVILDEATSALDSRTEFEVIRAIKNRGITCVIIAHRLSTIRDCDEIIVLRNGQVAERGTHEYLYSLDGEYAKLISTEEGVNNGMV